MDKWRNDLWIDSAPLATRTAAIKFGLTFSPESKYVEIVVQDLFWWTSGSLKGLCERARGSVADTYANLTWAGWSSKNNHLLIGEALSFEFEGKVLNPYGIDIDLPHWVFTRLKKLHLLERDRPTGKMRIRARVFGLMALWDGPDFRPDRRYRAFDPGYQRACSKDSGYSSAFLKALGKDCTGLVNPAVERTHRFESDLGHSRLSEEYRRAQVDEALRAVKAKRRAKAEWPMTGE
jgi:hypothetical protein